VTRPPAPLAAPPAQCLLASRPPPVAPPGDEQGDGPNHDSNRQQPAEQPAPREDSSPEPGGRRARGSCVASCRGDRVGHQRNSCYTINLLAATGAHNTSGDDSHLKQ